jgi:hypothetical protein
VTPKNDNEADEQRKVTLPPPPSGDAYSAETIVREVPPKVLEAIKARHDAEERSPERPATEPSPDKVKVVVAPESKPPPPGESLVFDDDDEPEAKLLVPVSLPPPERPMAPGPPEVATWRWLALVVVIVTLACAIVAAYLQPDAR